MINLGLKDMYYKCYFIIILFVQLPVPITGLEGINIWRNLKTVCWDIHYSY